MQVAIITESFPPDVNGVAHSVLRCAEHLVRRGHRPLVIAPEPASGTGRIAGRLPYPVIRVPSLPLPGYPTFRLGWPGRRLSAALRDHGTEVVHLASPFVLGARGAVVARQLGWPVVAVYQTDVPAYAAARGRRFGEMSEAAAWRWLRTVHSGADRTLAPSTASATALHAHGIQRVWLWRRGVDTERFAPGHRSAAVRRALAPNQETIIGYVGRLAVEKRLDLLAPIADRPDTRLVIVGGGPAEPALRRAMPRALFLGPRHGAQLARLYASLDVFVHSGPYETFGQTLQEAAASGVPVVAPARGGPLDLVEDGVTGRLVAPHSAAALAEAVAELVADPGQRARFGESGRRAMLGRSWESVGDELIGHYRAVLGESVPRPAPVRL